MKLIENVDYFYNEDNHMVFTREYLLKRGHCCQSGCQYCPYELALDPNTPLELNKGNLSPNEYQKYLDEN